MRWNFFFCLAACFALALRCPAQNEVIYHIFERSFYDANGDAQGDLPGIRAKLDYLQDLGVTSVLLTPLYPSVFYHNYFADDFEKIDPEYGTMKDYLELVREVHRRKMKIYLDMETQYITESHKWWKYAVGHPGSAYSDFILFDDTAHLKPSSMVFGITELKGFDGTVRKVATVNLHSAGVLAYNQRLFGFFVDPNRDGKFDDGVDGFRLDHMMDDLDGKGRLTDLFSRFWTPLLDSMKRINPLLTFVAEQANWGSWGFEYFAKGAVDRVFAFRLAGAIASFDKAQLIRAADTTLIQVPPGKAQVVFIENHDMDRFASRVGKDPGKERVGAVLNLLIGGIPSIYYGQELGMRGSLAATNYGTDANDIPRREAFEWFAADTGRGMALWYKGSGPWWDSTRLKAWDGISLQEEEKDPLSLWHFYKSLLALRKKYPVFSSGRYEALANSNPNVFTFLRTKGNGRVIVAVNLSGQVQEAPLKEVIPAQRAGAYRKIFGSASGSLTSGIFTISLPPYGSGVWEYKQ